MNTLPEVKSHLPPFTLQFAKNQLDLFRECRSANAFELFLFLSSKIKMNNSNKLVIKNKTIQNELGITSRQELSRRIKCLIRADAIIKIDYGYLINPKFVWVGLYEKRQTGKIDWLTEKGKNKENRK